DKSPAGSAQLVAVGTQCPNYESCAAVAVLHMLEPRAPGLGRTRAPEPQPPQYPAHRNAHSPIETEAFLGREPELIALDEAHFRVPGHLLEIPTQCFCLGMQAHAVTSG